MVPGLKHMAANLSGRSCKPAPADGPCSLIHSKPDVRSRNATCLPWLMSLAHGFAQGRCRDGRTVKRDESCYFRMQARNQVRGRQQPNGKTFKGPVTVAVGTGDEKRVARSTGDKFFIVSPGRGKGQTTSDSRVTMRSFYVSFQCMPIVSSSRE